VTGLIGVEEELIDLVAQQLSLNQQHPRGFVRQEVRRLVRTEDRISDVLDRLAAQGLSSDAVFQEDAARLTKIEDSLADLIAATFG